MRERMRDKKSEEGKDFENVCMSQSHYNSLRRAHTTTTIACMGSAHSHYTSLCIAHTTTTIACMGSAHSLRPERLSICVFRCSSIYCNGIGAYAFVCLDGDEASQPSWFVMVRSSSILCVFG